MSLLIFLLISLIGGPLATALPTVRFARMVITTIARYQLYSVTATTAWLWRLAGWGLLVARIFSILGLIATLAFTIWWCRRWWRSGEATLNPIRRAEAHIFEGNVEDLESEEEQMEAEESNAAQVEAMRTIMQGGSSRRSRAFIRTWVSALRNEFPLRANREADRGAMSVWLVKRLRARGMRHTHIARAVPRVVAVAINKSMEEAEAELEANEARLLTNGQRTIGRLLALIALRLGFPVLAPPA
jgi:hypothetical protein